MKLNPLLKSLGISMMMVSSILVIILFLTALFNDGIVTININLIGEAIPELLLLLFLTPLMIMVFIDYVKSI